MFILGFQIKSVSVSKLNRYKLKIYIIHFLGNFVVMGLLFGVIYLTRGGSDKQLRAFEQALSLAR